MRAAKDLKDVVDAALVVSDGACPIVVLARDPEESAALWALLKGRRGNKAVTIRIAKPEEFSPVMDLARRTPAPPPAPAVADLDFDGY